MSIRRLALPLGLLALALFEAAAVWFVMPLPGSQRVRSVELAYTLHALRWPIRALCLVMIAWGAPAAPRAGWRRWALTVLALATGGITYATNFVMAADRIFQQPESVTMVAAAATEVAPDRLVVGVVVNGEARAYPLQFIGYHHFLTDTIAGRPVLVTYCTVCRTGRVFDPVLDGAVERFRLVGMDEFNAMLEDRTTGSWWRQANGEALVGPRRGTVLAEVASVQVTLRRWIALHPSTQVMRGDPRFTAAYDKDYAFERGTSRRTLTGTDPRSWERKSWVVGVSLGGADRAYDWNALLKVGAINDTLAGRPIVLVVATDSASFFAFERPSAEGRLLRDGDSLRAGPVAYGFNGRGPVDSLQPVGASQEFWHSWQSFHPRTTRYP
ncbi:MAG: DUF3179 domain-containing (seleno)protein [Gemmatimonadota bacterium]|jgi:hypothetical protein|nr:DUF3179 domain-containing protein [Gemmatimonadota bacterium]MDQ8150868.1 DUF3179 domain-containing (seleno)protein [Gemmatimonadota bacterium]MDQ8152550.1 DUF3179 domain-containing (seleno)protein [Gemmatimonadota bacterium]MDQ8175426.1 DUF3179 domain-containing (seleno)protein [Gemmatimonadota bacterium]MDQ8178458.1 DUF3179 domain-containing (seleno)protein [Gemmatimonadota bacterium]